jgi:tRNA-Thr(GGU) m(6)t(6)A37 methyltransferase TsaA
MIQLQPIGIVKSERTKRTDDHWGEFVSTITLVPGISEDSFNGIESFSHLEILFYMHKVDQNSICCGTRYPRDNPAWPKVGIFAQRGSNRPNQIGLSVVKLLHRKGRTLIVKGLDAIDGTPVLDVKPVFREFLPQGKIKQPSWVDELMKDYF